MRLGIKKRHGRSAIVITLLPFVFCVICRAAIKRAEPTFTAYISDFSNRAFSDAVNKCAASAAASGEYGDFYTVLTDGDRRVTSLEADTAKINAMKSKLLEDIQRETDSRYPAVIRIPVGSLTGCAFLAAYGFGIPIKIMPIGSVRGELEDEFVSAGINQVKHSVVLKVSADMSYVGYALNRTETVTDTVPIAETVIAGEVPQYNCK